MPLITNTTMNASFHTSGLHNIDEWRKKTNDLVVIYDDKIQEYQHNPIYDLNNYFNNECSTTHSIKAMNEDLLDGFQILKDAYDTSPRQQLDGDKWATATMKDLIILTIKYGMSAIHTSYVDTASFTLAQETMHDVSHIVDTAKKQGYLSEKTQREEAITSNDIEKEKNYAMYNFSRQLAYYHPQPLTENEKVYAEKVLTVPLIQNETKYINEHPDLYSNTFIVEIQTQLIETLRRITYSSKLFSTTMDHAKRLTGISEYDEIQDNKLNDYLESAKVFLYALQDNNNIAHMMSEDSYIKKTYLAWKKEGPINEKIETFFNALFEITEQEAPEKRQVLTQLDYKTKRQRLSINHSFFR